MTQICFSSKIRWLFWSSEVVHLTDVEQNMQRSFFYPNLQLILLFFRRLLILSWPYSKCENSMLGTGDIGTLLSLVFWVVLRVWSLDQEIEVLLLLFFYTGNFAIRGWVILTMILHVTLQVQILWLFSRVSHKHLVFWLPWWMFYLFAIQDSLAGAFLDHLVSLPRRIWDRLQLFFLPGEN